MNEDTPIYDHNSVEMELLALMVMDYDEEHGYCFPMDEEVEKAIQLKKEYLKEKNNCTELQNFTEQKQIRAGWREAFAKYAEEGEDEMLLPDCVDCDENRELGDFEVGAGGEGGFCGGEVKMVIENKLN